MRIKAVIAYDGTDYGGFQRQKNAPSIQQGLEEALETLIGAPTGIVAAGRTDAGVHAEGQVIAFDTLWPHSLTDLQRGLNALLPEAIAVLRLDVVADNFHPRYAALRRCYRYALYLAPVRNPLVSRYSLHIMRPLNLDAMQAAAQNLVGQHDFAAFGSPPKGENTIREVYQAEWSTEGDWLYFDISANAFLYRMVRMSVGTLLRVGYGALTLNDFGEILQNRERRRAGPAVKARGLCLRHVVYPNEMFSVS